MNVPFVPLKDVVVTKTGSRNPSATPDMEFDYVDVASVDNAEKRITGARRMVGQDAPSRARKLIRTGDVLLATIRPNLNAVALVPPSLDGEVASTGFCVLRARDAVLPEYLFYFCRSASFVGELCKLVAGAMYPAVTDSQVLDQRLPMRELGEQRRIVDLLSRAEGIVRLRREAAAKAAELIPALFIHHFGDPATNPMGWPVTTLGEVVVRGPSNGLYKHKSAYGKGVPILRIDAFYDGVVRDLSTLKRLQVEPDELQRFGLQQNDIVINRVNSPEYLGKSALIPTLAEPTVFESNMMRLAVDPARALPRYVIALLQTGAARAHFLSNAKHAINQSSINQQDVKSLPLALPPIEVQQTFLTQASAMESIQRQQIDALAKAQATFDALLAQAFAPT